MNEFNKLERLKKIDGLLKNDVLLEEYINQIEQKSAETPSYLNEKIITKVKRKKNKYYADICKIAACLIFSLAICRTDFIKNDNISENQNNKINKVQETEENKTETSINKKISDLCKWLTTPINLEKEEK